jgi:ADP-heptose:LPS heptosyltransferase
MIDQPPASPLCGKYLVRNRVLNRLLRLTDRLLERCRWLSWGWHARGYSEGRGATPREYPQACHPAIAKPRRILIANGAHLGDVFLSLSVLPALRSAFPDARIGFLCGTWARCLFDQQHLVEWLHHVDHWKLNRSARPLHQKLVRYHRTRRQALREIRRSRYDIAIDLYYYFPNSIPLLWQAGIPCRIGYTSGGFGPLLTHALDWKPADRHVTGYQADLLRVLGVSDNNLQKTHVPLPSADSQLPCAVEEDLRKIGVRLHGIVVFHMGTAAAMKEWPLPHWRQLAHRLAAEGYSLIFTGTGGREWRNSEEVRAGLPKTVNFCGRLTWNELAAVFHRVRLLVGVDSVAGHLAAAAGTPCVVISSGITSPAHWRPRSPACRVLSQPVPCSPCYRSQGCEGMECVRLVSVQRVHDSIREIISLSHQQGA